MGENFEDISIGGYFENISISIKESSIMNIQSVNINSAVTIKM